MYIFFILLDTFRAYDIDNDNRICKKQFVEIVKDSWMTAFRLLADQVRVNLNTKTNTNANINANIQQNHIKLTVKDFEEWAQSKISLLN